MPDAKKPIILRDPEVRAVQAGRATVRRAVKPGGSPVHRDRVEADESGWRLLRDGWAWCVGAHVVGGVYPCPLGAVGERRWVREAFGVGSRPDPFDGSVDGIEYRADDFDLDEKDIIPLRRVESPPGVDLDSFRSGWHSAVAMPRWASRLTVQIVAVRVEKGADGWEWVVEMERAEVVNG